MDGVKRDGERIWLYRLTIVGTDHESALCAPDARGESWALPFVDAGDQVSFACTSGAIGKCILFGYLPSHAAAGRLHQACLRMVRADYGGDGTSSTREGTLISFCDQLGIHPCRRVRGLEAAWSERGAVCVGRPRIPELITLEELSVRFPQLRGRLGEHCTFADVAGDKNVLLMSWVPN